jgi:formylglycine-generating enzyme required for sulfatase activity
LALECTASASPSVGKTIEENPMNRITFPLLMGLSLGPLLCWAAEPKKPSDTKQITSSIGMKLTLVPSGEFMMGSKESAEATAAFFNKTYGANFQAEDFKGQHPQHRVRITRPFYLGVYHVTRVQSPHSGENRHFSMNSSFE